MMIHLAKIETVLKEAANIDGHIYFSDIVPALRAAGYVVVPIEPSVEMIEEAWGSALAEDATGVWRDMIETSQRKTPAADTRMTYFTAEQWARIPLPLKQRWWKDTDYGAHDPRSPSLISMWWAIRDGLIDHLLLDRLVEAYDHENELVPRPA